MKSWIDGEKGWDVKWKKKEVYLYSSKTDCNLFFLTNEYVKIEYHEEF